MSMDEESLIKTLTVYEAIKGDRDDMFDVDPHDDTIDKDLKPIEEFVKLQHGPKPKPGQCML